VLGIALGALGVPVLRQLFDPALATALSFALALLVVVVFEVVLGELVPKALALHRAAPLAAALAPTLVTFDRLLHPVVWTLQAGSGLVLRPLRVPAAPVGTSVRSVEELREMLADAEDSGLIEEAEEEMLYRVFDFADQEVGDVMVPWSDVTALPVELSASDALERIVDQPHTRYPVYRDDIDHIVGVLHVRDLFIALREGSEDEVRIEALLRPPAFVPEMKDLGALLGEMRRSGQHLAIVINEYGSTIGLATLEDLVEEIIGEIEDEFDLPDESVVHLDDGRMRVHGNFTVDDFNEQFHTKLPQERFRTLGGLVFGELGRQARVGDLAHLAGVEFTVDEVDGPRVERLVVRLPDERQA
jgi:putative hemolysin